MGTSSTLGVPPNPYLQAYEPLMLRMLFRNPCYRAAPARASSVHDFDTAVINIMATLPVVSPVGEISFVCAVTVVRL